MTKRQIDLMDEMNIPHDPSMTRGEASDAISEEIETSPHPFSEEAFG